MTNYLNKIVSYIRELGRYRFNVSYFLKRKVASLVISLPFIGMFNAKIVGCVIAITYRSIFFDDINKFIKIRNTFIKVFS